ncbi:MAG: F0F1 ATP synthase subunit delta [Candidatus Nanopelagicales bacterium]
MLGTSRDSLNSLVASLSSVTIDESVVQACREIFEVCGILESDKALRSALADSGRSPESRKVLVEDLFKAKISTIALLVLSDVATNRWSSESDIIEALEELSARLLFLTSQQKGELDAVEQELFRIARLVQTNSELQMALTNPALDSSVKSAVMNDLLAKQVNSVTLLIAQHVVANLRDQRADAAFSRMSDIAASIRNRTVAEVRVAIALSAEQSTKLASVLKRLAGKDVSLNVIIDPNIIGGVSVRLGDEVFDGSIHSRLEQARRVLV